MSSLWRVVLGTSIRGLFSIIIGVILLSLGIWFILTAAPSDQTVFFLRVPVYLIVGGFFRLVYGVATIELRQRPTSFARPARPPITTYVSPPAEMVPGYCWQCGRRVKRKYTICYGCGATQVRAGPSRQQGDPMSQVNWESVASTPPNASPWSAESAPPEPDAAASWNAPPYQPGPSSSPRRGNTPPDRSGGSSHQRNGPPTYQPGARPPWAPPVSLPAQPGPPPRGGRKRRRSLPLWQR